MRRLDSARLADAVRRMLKERPDIAQELGVNPGQEVVLEFEDAKVKLSRPKRIDRYPWSPYNQSDLRMLCQGDIDAAVANTWDKLVNEIGASYGSDAAERVSVDEAAEATQRVMYALSRWLRSDRTLINVSHQATQILKGVYDERVEAGLTPARWRDLPGPGSSLYAKGVMFFWEGRGLYTFACPYGLVMQEHLEYVEWGLQDYPNNEGTGWGIRTRYPFTVSRQWCDRDEMRIIQIFRDDIPDDVDFAADDITQETYRRLGGHRKHFGALSDTINVLAAMNSGVELVCERKTGKRSGKRTRALGGLRSVRPLQLDVSGMYTWSKRYVTLPSDGPEGEGGETYSMDDVEYPDDRHPPCMHHVDQHLMTLWVREPKANEEIFAMKEGKNGTVLYAVKRVRGSEDGYMRGQGVKANRQRLKAGPDDLNIPGGD